MGVALPHSHPPREGCKEEVLAGVGGGDSAWSRSGLAAEQDAGHPFLDALLQRKGPQSISSLTHSPTRQVSKHLGST